jgi:hypothetical protein
MKVQSTENMTITLEGMEIKAMQKILAGYLVYARATAAYNVYDLSIANDMLSQIEKRFDS